MQTFLTAVALSIALPAAAFAQAAPAAPATGPSAQQMPMGQVDHGKMMGMTRKGDGCCKQTAGGKMGCNMPGMTGAAPTRKQ